MSAWRFIDPVPDGEAVVVDPDNDGEANMQVRIMQPDFQLRVAFVERGGRTKRWNPDASVGRVRMTFDQRARTKEGSLLQPQGESSMLQNRATEAFGSPAQGQARACRGKVHDDVPVRRAHRKP